MRKQIEGKKLIKPFLYKCFNTHWFITSFNPLNLFDSHQLKKFFLSTIEQWRNESKEISTFRSAFEMKINSINWKSIFYYLFSNWRVRKSLNNARYELKIFIWKKNWGLKRRLMNIKITPPSWTFKKLFPSSNDVQKIFQISFVS